MRLGNGVHDNHQDIFYNLYLCFSLLGPALTVFARSRSNFPKMITRSWLGKWFENWWKWFECFHLISFLISHLDLMMAVCTSMTEVKQRELWGYALINILWGKLHLWFSSWNVTILSDHRSWWWRKFRLLLWQHISIAVLCVWRWFVQGDTWNIDNCVCIEIVVVLLYWNLNVFQAWDRRALNESHPRAVGKFAGHACGIACVDTKVSINSLKN